MRTSAVALFIAMVSVAFPELVLAEDSSGRELRIEATGCSGLDRQRFGELLVLDLRDEGEVIDRALTVALWCRPESVVIRATDRDGGITVERRIPPPQDTEARQWILALSTSELLRVARWTEPEPEKEQEAPTTQIVVEEQPTGVPLEEPGVVPEAILPKPSRATVGVAGLVVARFPGSRVVTFGGELRGGIRIKGPWWVVASFGFETRNTEGSLAELNVLGLHALAGVAWRTWWTRRIGWENAVRVGGGYLRLRGKSADPSLTNSTHSSGVFDAVLSTGPRWRFGRVWLGADVRLGLSAPKVEESAPPGTISPRDSLSLNVARIVGALTLDVAL